MCKLKTLLALLLLPGLLHAADKEIAVTEKPAASLYDRIWSYADLYENPDNPVIQSLAFTGRYQLDYALLDSDFDYLGTRRWRMGGKATLFKEFTLHVETELDNNESPWYQRLTDAYLAWAPSKAFKLTVGKQSAPFTMDGMTSSKELLAIDRSNLSNNLWFPQEYIPGVTVSGQLGNWRYLSGGFSAGKDDKEFGRFNASYFLLQSIGYDFAKALGVKKALLMANYVYQDADPLNGFTRQLEEIGSLNFNYDTGKWGVRTDLSAAKGYLGQSDLWGFTIMPFYSITEKLQAVARYTYISSDEPGGIRFARYESSVVSGRGDQYNEIYAGLNYYIYGHKLKLQTGVQYAEMQDSSASQRGEYRGWACTTGLRVSW